MEEELIRPAIELGAVTLVRVAALFCCNKSSFCETILEDKDQARMDLEMVARTIQLIIAPAVMITSCCIFTNGLPAHYASIGERLRVTVRERLDLLREAEINSRRRPATEERRPELVEGSVEGLRLIVQERLGDIDFQIPNLLRHHLFVRTSLAGAFIAIVVYILDMFVIAYSVLSDRTDFYGAILVVFLLGVASQLVGVLYSVIDAFMSHKIYAYETRHAMSLEKTNPEHTKI